jgi:hypothetical protein
MPYSGMLRRVALVCTNVSEERITSIIRLKNGLARENVSSNQNMSYTTLRSVLR